MKLQNSGAECMENRSLYQLYTVFLQEIEALWVKELNKLKKHRLGSQTLTFVTSTSHWSGPSQIIPFGVPFSAFLHYSSLY